MTEMNRRDVLRLIGTAALACAAPPSPATSRSMDPLPRIGLGTWQTFDVAADDAALAPLRALLARFLADGGRVVDTSPMYGRAETVLGRLLAAIPQPPRPFVATKVWTTGRDAGVRQVESSEEKIGRRPLDLVQVHNLVDVDTHLDTLEAWKAEGRVRHTGITHYSRGAHDDLARVATRRRVDFVQVNYSLAEPEAERRLLPLARERGIAVLVNRPFAEGALFARVRGREVPAFAREELGVASWAQYFLKFIVSHPAVTAVIPATSKLAHLVDNLAAGAGPMPDAAQRARMLREFEAD